MAHRAREFGQRADISARSLVVTIFGDSIAPSGGQIWLGELIELGELFGYSDRLVRTSVFRLSGEGWFDVERVGRRSRYALTAFGREEFAHAEQRIYRADRPTWGGDWTLVFTQLGGLERDSQQQLATHLGWQGFMSLAPGVYALPGDGRPRLAGVRERLAIGEVPVASATFDDLRSLVTADGVESLFDLVDIAQRYRELSEEFAWADRRLDEVEHLQGADAFALRTMLVHELRRITLADPWLPVELLPEDWPGLQVHGLAARIYRAVDSAAWTHLATTTSLTPPPARHPASARFGEMG